MSIKSLNDALEVDKLTENQKTAAFVISTLWPHMYNKTLREDEATSKSIEQAEKIMDWVKAKF